MPLVERNRLSNSIYSLIVADKRCMDASTYDLLHFELKLLDLALVLAWLVKAVHYLIAHMNDLFSCSDP